MCNLIASARGGVSSVERAVNAEFARPRRMRYSSSVSRRRRQSEAALQAPVSVMTGATPTNRLRMEKKHNERQDIYARLVELHCPLE